MGKKVKIQFLLVSQEHNVFLVTTSDRRFWDFKDDEEVLFLGEWCKLDKDRRNWESLNYRVLPYHWDDREKLYQDYLIIEKIYERCLEDLSKELNSYHQTSYSVRYWRLVVGPWLKVFIETLYDKWLSISAARDSELVTGTTQVDTDDGFFCLKDFLEQASAFQDEKYEVYHAYLYSKIMSYLDLFPKNVSKIKFSSSTKMGKLASIKLKLRNFLIGAIKVGEIAMLDYPPKSLLRMCFSFKKRPSLSHLYPVNLENYQKYLDTKGRSSIHITPSASKNFDGLLAFILPKVLPVAYIEGYSALKKATFHLEKWNVKLILLGCWLYTKEEAKLWAADHVERGCSLAVYQHGGVYGTAKWSSFEEHERAVADNYLTWGWSDKRHFYSKTIPAASYKLSQHKKHNGKEHGPLLICTNVWSKYAYRMMASPVGPQIQQYIDWVVSIIDSLGRGFHDSVLVRVNQSISSTMTKEITSNFDQVKVENQSAGSFIQSLARSRLAIFADNSTTFLESLSINCPTILCFDSKLWEIREEAAPYFEKLRNVGIFYDSVQSAAEHINTVFENPQRWWLDKEVQEARKLFCQQYAFNVGDWERHQSNLFKQLLKES